MVGMGDGVFLSGHIERHPPEPVQGVERHAKVRARESALESELWKFSGGFCKARAKDQ